MVNRTTAADIVNHLSERINISKSIVKDIFVEISRFVQENLANDTEVIIPNLLKLIPTISKPRKAWNFQTGEMIDVPEKKKIRTRLLKELKKI